MNSDSIVIIQEFPQPSAHSDDWNYQSLKHTGSSVRGISTRGTSGVLTYGLRAYLGCGAMVGNTRDVIHVILCRSMIDEISFNSIKAQSDNNDK